jgi:hypothetical protein
LSLIPKLEFGNQEAPAVKQGARWQEAVADGLVREDFKTLRNAEPTAAGFITVS